MSYQTTIERPVATKGVGLHTAVKSHLRLVPAPADTGIVFRRVDLDNFEIEAHVRNVARVSYATSLMKKGVLLSTTEHLLAALYSCGVDNVYIELDALELPILDGSSQPFIEMLAAGRNPPAAEAAALSEGREAAGIFRRRTAHRHLPGGRFPGALFRGIRASRGGRAGNRDARGARVVQPDAGARRTFGFVQDFEGLRRMGLIRGGSLENAIVLNESGVMNGPLRFPDEFGRHKALDLIGDLALVGRPLLARVEAHKAGHALHTQLVTRLLADPSLWTETYDEAPREPSHISAPRPLLPLRIEPAL